MQIQAGGEVPSPVEWVPAGAVRMVDQTRLPLELVYETCTDVESLADAVRHLKVRGAPAIGIAAAYGLCLAAHRSTAQEMAELIAGLEGAAALLASTRPTAVNLSWALGTVMQAARSAAPSGDTELVRKAVYEAARRIERENDQATKWIGEHGASLLRDGMNLLTHCNTGPLAAGGIGTALGVIYTAHRQGKRLHVWVDETRPLLQGARLTTWELGRWGVPYTLVADNMAASLMRAGWVDAVLVGADRIAANGDVANKIGTYGLAVLARAHQIPLYIAAPLSSFDPNISSGDAVQIEERRPEEITHHGGKRLAPPDAQVYNPAFDVTPHHLVNCIICESGLLYPPLARADVEAMVERSSIQPAQPGEVLASSR